MSYNPATDFLALLRMTSGGERSETVPGLDYVVAALARAGMFQLSVGQFAPTTNQTITAWFKPAIPSWSAEGTLFLWNAGNNEYEPATLALWQALFSSGGSGAVVVQTITAPGPAIIGAATTIVLVTQLISAPITLNMPLAAAKVGSVLISDWKGDASGNIITVQLAGADKFPGGGNTWQIASDTGSIFLRPIPQGYVL